MLDWFYRTIPFAATEAARDWDMLFLFLFGVCVAFFLLVMVPLVLFIIQYRRAKNTKPEYISHNDSLEILWTAIPTVVLMVIFAWGYVVYSDLQHGAPRDAMEIRVVADGAWQWTFQYPDGRTTKNELFVPVDEPIRLVVTSEPGQKGVAGSSSMIHSFFVPNFRIKKDAVPGVYNYTWFQADTVGQHIFFCTEYCGSQHSLMYGRVVVLEEKKWQRFLWNKLTEAEIDAVPWVGYGAMADRFRKDAPDADAVLDRMDQFTTANLESNPEDLIAKGKEITMAMGCNACHSDDGSMKLAPSYKGLFGRTVQLADGSEIIADENYIRESITLPQAKVVAGYEHLVMPPYPGQLSELELNALLAYLKSVN